MVEKIWTWESMAAGLVLSDKEKEDWRHMVEAWEEGSPPEYFPVVRDNVGGKLFHGRGRRRRRGEEVRRVTGMLEGLQNLATVGIDFTDDRDDIFQVRE